ncbi:MAG: hypothetical protein MK324_08360, partial [Pirellulales bacterium]|nr:hypothetical protein [Pirellulales bacterium]
LSDTETIAQLATGRTRFDLPEEFNVIRILKEIAAVEDDTQSTYIVQASKTLAQLFQNRRQYPKAAKVLRNTIKRYPQTAKNSGFPIMLKAIVGNLGAFDPSYGQTTNEQNVFTYKCRNAQ